MTTEQIGMDKEKIDRIDRVIAEQLGVSPSDIKATTNIVDDLGADSLDTVELVMAFEDEFEMEISDEEAHKFVTVQDIYNRLAKL